MPRARTRTSALPVKWGTLVMLVMMAAGSHAVSAAVIRSADGGADDWCFHVSPDNRIENSAARLSCGTCDGARYPTACRTTADCWAGGTCSSLTTEVVWYDLRADGTPNDLRTIATAQDEFALYFIILFWDGVDPMLLPFGQLPIDFQPGGSHDLVDPLGAMVAPGVCSGSSDRACTGDEDCHFCTDDFELPPCCDFGTCTGGEFCRVSACGTGCTNSTCDTSQTCRNLGTTPLSRVGVGSILATRADYLLRFDFGRLFVGLDPVQLDRWAGAWTPLATFELGASGGVPEYGSPLFEVEVPWSLFGCTGWTESNGCGAGTTAASCGCPDFGPGTEFTFTYVVARDELSLDFTPRGAIEDVASETVAGMTTLTANDCPGAGIGTTRCEIADGSTDSFFPLPALAPGGSTPGLTAVRASSGTSPSITLIWDPSCSSGDTDYAVYEGDLAALPAYDHDRVLCSTFGATTATFDAGPGDRYFLVVPTDGTEEGSYGTDGTGTQRPPAAAACRNQVVSFACPF